MCQPGPAVHGYGRRSPARGTRPGGATIYAAKQRLSTRLHLDAAMESRLNLCIRATKRKTPGFLRAAHPRGSRWSHLRLKRTRPPGASRRPGAAACESGAQFGALRAEMHNPTQRFPPAETMLPPR